MPVNNRARYLLIETRRLIGSKIRELKRHVKDGGTLDADQIEILRSITSSLVAAVKAERDVERVEQDDAKGLTDAEIAAAALASKKPKVVDNR